MSALTPELKKLEALEGTEIPGRTVVLSRHTRQDGAGMIDAVAQITERAIDGTLKGDHIFKLTLPERPEDFRGTIEVDDTKEGEPRVKIVAHDIFEEDPGLLGAVVRVGLTESGVSRAIVEARFTNLSPDFLRQAARPLIQGAAEALGDQAIVFSSTPPGAIDNHSIAT